MKVDRKKLVAALDTVRKAVATQDIVPILSHFLVEGGEITATDMDIGMVTTFEAFEGMAFLIPADRFYALVAGLPQDAIEVSIKKGHLSIKAKGHRSKLAIVDVPKDFPRVRREFRKWLTPLPGLADALKVCLKTINEARGAAFGSVLWDEGGFVSSDTEVITWCPHKTKGHQPTEAVLLSSKFVREAVRLGQPEGWVIHEGAICFKYGDTQLLGHLVQATFPERWRSYFPEEVPSNLISLGTAVRQSLARIGQFSDRDVLAAGTEGLTQVSLDGKSLALSYADTEGGILEKMKVQSNSAHKFAVDSIQLAEVLAFCGQAAYVEVNGRPILYLQGEDAWPRIVMSVQQQSDDDD